MSNRSAIITLYGLLNYGNRLQNYALQEVMLHKCIETVSLLPSSENKIRKLAKIILKKQNGKLFLKNYSDFLNDKRKKNFQNFVNLYMDFLQINDLENSLTNLNDSFSYFVVGSDQVWNPLLWNPQNPMPEYNRYLLPYISPQKRIAYAASFGIEKLPIEWENKMAVEIEKFKAISVREKAGAEIVKKMIGRDVPVVLDPTMLLTAEQWREIETQRIKKNNKYVLTYFLGAQPKDVYEEIHRIANNIDAEIVELMNYKNKYYTLGPDGFLEMIDHAQIVFTDSFHGSVFSILFHRPFMVYQRHLENHPDMGSRLDTLLEKTQLTERVRNREMITEEDFKKADMLIEKEREASIQFLQEALS